ncbi:hypothetical protein DOY81_000027, partial [Sarcophaga bullata]
MNSLNGKHFVLLFCILLHFVFPTQGAGNRTRTVVDICERQPTINGLCGSSTLGIYYDAETERCKYLGCSPDKKIFQSLEDCEKICN